MQAWKFEAKKRLRTKFVTIAALILLLIICLSALYVFTKYQATGIVAESRDILFQASSFQSFAPGEYAGYLTFSELAKHGDFGIGTVNGLDGEMIALNGKFYQIPFDGNPKQISPSTLTPYATVTFFDVDQTFHVNEVTYTQLAEYINQSLPSTDAIYAIKVTGNFDYAKTRSVPNQTQPYPELTEVIAHQSIFNLTDVSATAAGFYFPDSMNGVDAVGYHLHLLTFDLLAGGHLLDCTIKDATVEIDYIHKFTLILP